MVGRRAALLSACVAFLCGCGTAKKAEPPSIVVARESASGKQASATASADAKLYKRFAVAVTASPNQRVSGGWVVSCKVSTTSSREADNFSGRTPLSIPVRAFADKNCAVVALATLARSGRVTVKMLAAQ
jgi:hypothetical protein